MEVRTSMGCTSKRRLLLELSSIILMSISTSTSTSTSNVNIHDANTAYDTFRDKFSQIYNNCKRLITKNICLDRPYKSWITKGIIKSIHKKSRLYKEAIRQIIPFLSIKFIKIN